MAKFVGLSHKIKQGRKPAPHLPIFKDYAATAGEIPPNDLEGLELWLESNTDVLNSAGEPAENNDPTKDWIDQGPSGLTFTQEDADDYPTYETGAIGGQPVINCADASAESLYINTCPWSANGAGTLFVVMKMAAGRNYMFVSSNAAANNTYVVFGTNGGKMELDVRAGANRNLVQNYNETPEGTAVLMMFQSTGMGYVFGLNNANETLNVFSGSDNGNWFSLMNPGNSSIGSLIRLSSDLFEPAIVSEIVLTNNAVAGDTLTGVQTYFNNKYSLW